MVLRGFVRDETVRRCLNGSGLRDFASPCEQSHVLADGGGKSERFTWDGLALVQRGDATMINEPHVGGGNPVVSSAGTTYFNDVFGTTVGARRQSRYAANSMTAFGEGGSRHAFFTGKP